MPVCNSDASLSSQSFLSASRSLLSYIIFAIFECFRYSIIEEKVTTLNRMGFPLLTQVKNFGSVSCSLLSNFELC